MRCEEGEEDETHRLWLCGASCGVRHRHGLSLDNCRQVLGHEPCVAFLARCLVPKTWTRVVLPLRPLTPVQETEGWLQQLGGLHGDVATDGAAGFGED